MRATITAFVLLAATACSTEDTEDSSLPTVAFRMPQTNYVGHDVVTSLDTHDDRGVVLVRLFLDNDLVAEQQFAPYDVQWSATGFSEGNHLLKAVAVDDEGLEGSVSRQVIVDLTSPEITCSDVYTDATWFPLPSCVQDDRALRYVIIEARPAVAGPPSSEFRCPPETTFTATGCGVIVLHWEGEDWAGNRASASTDSTITVGAEGYQAGTCQDGPGFVAEGPGCE